jgi:hypothetical protein
LILPRRLKLYSYSDIFADTIFDFIKYFDPGNENENWSAPKSLYRHYHVVAGTRGLPGVLHRRPRPRKRTAAGVRLIMQAIKGATWPKERHN